MKYTFEGDIRMRYSQIRLVLGESPKRGPKKEIESLDKYFLNPIIHRQINGDEIYIPLNLDRIWNQIS